MLQIISNDTKNSLTSLQSETSFINNSFTSDNLYINLAKLSHQKQWILYTAECPRPIQSELGQHNINCANVIHLKPSHYYSEEEIVIKAVKAGTASAVVASQHLDSHARARIIMMAKLHRCSVFFLDSKSKSYHPCH